MKQRAKAYLVYNEVYEDWDLCSTLKVAREPGRHRVATDVGDGVLACMDHSCVVKLFGTTNKKLIHVVHMYPRTQCPKPKKNWEKV